MSRRMPVSEAALLSRTNARIYCGGLGEETFDRELAHVAPRMIKGRRFYRRSDLDAWVAGPDTEGPNPLLKAISNAFREGARCPQANS